MMQQERANEFNDLAADYARYRIGYSSELYDVIESLGMRRGSVVLDAGCGTGLSTQPLLTRGMRVTGVDPAPEMLEAAKLCAPQATFVAGRVEALPFADGTFDAAVSAQAFHWFDAEAAFAELLRVVKPGGPICVWWKILGTDDSMREMRAKAARQAGVEVTPDPLSGGFRAFYRAPFATRTLRVLPFIARFPIEDWLGYERSRATSRNAYGERRQAYLDALSTALVAKYGSLRAPLDVRYSQFLYVGKSAP